MRVAVIDLGTNTFKLLVAEQEGGGMRILHSAETPVFLGKGGIEAGTIAHDAFERGIQALAAYVATARVLGVERIAGFGTSALRNARNAQQFVDRAHAEHGIAITIVPGEEEAGLILDGVRQAVTFTARPMLVMDIGGGSIEFILATDKALMWKRSFELGVTRLLERIAPNDPLTEPDEARIAQHLDDRLGPLWAVLEAHEPAALVGSAGSFDTLAHMVAATRGAALGHDARTLDMSAVEFAQRKDDLMVLPRDQRSRVPGLPAHRVDTIPLALIAIDRVLTAGIERLVWSAYALKEGAAARLLRP